MEKLYYSISEVAEMLDISQSNLRFWEKEFPQLHPRRSPKGTRYYTNEDIVTIKQIIFLVNEQNLTLQGAKNKLDNKKDSVTKQQQLVERLKKIKLELKGLSNALSKND